MKRLILILTLILGFGCPFCFAADPLLQAGDRVAIIGDSITEQKLYSLYMEEYLLMCQPAGSIRTCQFGWSGEQAPGFLARMNGDAAWFKPTVATTCYGMNDGGYSPMTPDKAKRYRDSQKAIVQQFKKWGVRTIIVGSPGCVDAFYFRKDPAAAAMYNKTLAELRDIAREVAADEGVTFANVYDPMIDSMNRAKAKYGEKFAFAGTDGVHPGSNGHLLMAYAFLKAMGCDGNLGTITIDAGANKAEADGGHKVISAKEGSVEIESTRYPFCLFGKPDDQSTRNAADFSMFNQDLNRLTLVVKNIGADKAKVTWGGVAREFSSADLAKGINLAAEFMENPFSKPFADAHAAMMAQQNFETPLHKTVMHSLAGLESMLPEEAESFDRIVKAAAARQKKLSDASAAAVRPVTHTIKVEAVK